MKNLIMSIDDDLFKEIDRRTTPDFDHSDVVQKLLKKSLSLPQPTIPHKPDPTPRAIQPAKDGIVSFVQTPEYRVLSGINKYLAVLGWLANNRPNEFKKLDQYRRGKRVYFGKSQQEVEGSGKNIKAKPIPGSTVWALETLDNRAKKDLLADVLRICDCESADVNAVVDTIRHQGELNSEEIAAKYSDC
jgi:negative regulator of replication initiation